ncbi:hypothetical protein GCM10009677_33860 [Sphaerisporangium rubeum]
MEVRIRWRGPHPTMDVSAETMDVSTGPWRVKLLEREQLARDLHEEVSTGPWTSPPDHGSSDPNMEAARMRGAHAGRGPMALR